MIAIHLKCILLFEIDDNFIFVLSLFWGTALKSCVYSRIPCNYWINSELSDEENKKSTNCTSCELDFEEGGRG